MMKHYKIYFITGFALFAMFFGAGNIVFPLKLGVLAGNNIVYAICAFILAGVFMPYLGMYALSLFEGNYWAFFKPLGKILSFSVITFILLIIGPLFAAPRTAVVTYNTFAPYLPTFLNHALIFNALYFLIVLGLILKPNRIVDIIGRFISPVKISIFIALIIVALASVKQLSSHTPAVSTVIHHALSFGYGTMDLLGAFFYCAVAYQYVKLRCEKIGVTNPSQIQRIMLKGCVVGACTTTIIYIGFMLSAYSHANHLLDVPTESMISALSILVLGKFSAFFVCIFVFMASIATATALAEVSADYFSKTLFLGKLSRNTCLGMVLIVMYAMSILGFRVIMEIATPILIYLYPALIIYSGVRLIAKKYSMKNDILIDLDDDQITTTGT